MPRLRSASHSRWFWGLRLHPVAGARVDRRCLVVTPGGSGGCDCTCRPRRRSCPSPARSPAPMPTNATPAWTRSPARTWRGTARPSSPTTRTTPWRRQEHPLAQHGQTLIADKGDRSAAFEAQLNAVGITLVRPAAAREPPRAGRRFLRSLRPSRCTGLVASLSARAGGRPRVIRDRRLSLVHVGVGRCGLLGSAMLGRRRGDGGRWVVVGARRGRAGGRPRVIRDRRLLLAHIGVGPAGVRGSYAIDGCRWRMSGSGAVACWGVRCSGVGAVMAGSGLSLAHVGVGRCGLLGSAMLGCRRGDGGRWVVVGARRGGPAGVRGSYAIDGCHWRTSGSGAVAC